MSGRHQRWLRPLATLLVAAMISGCALPLDAEPNGLNADGAYDEIVLGETTTTVESALQVVDPTNLGLYFVGADGQLRILQRGVDVPQIPQILDQLEVPPTEEELEQFPDLTTRVIQAFEAKNLGRLNKEDQLGLLTIEVAPLLQATATETPRQAREAVSQIVCTITALRFIDNPIPITSVAFVDVDQNPLSITDSEGAAIESPFQNSDFNDCETAEDIAAEDQADEAEGTSTTEGS